MIAGAFLDAAQIAWAFARVCGRRAWRRMNGYDQRF
jgi:hypothetical protein